MKLTVNGEAHELDVDRPTVAALLDELGIEQRRGMALAMDAAVVPRSRWEETIVPDGAAIEIVRATQGG